MDIHQVLLKYWGHQSFRPRQEEIIQSVLDGKDTLALLPTGGGKSVCFQVPALVMDGMCLVISPLIALMKDQVENLKKKGISAATIYSGMSRTEIEVVISNAVHSSLKFLYISPERLKTDIITQNIHRMNINLLAVDEAHCISQWGYDFRPSYLEIANIKSHLEQVPTLALTATATPQVVDDIQDKLLFREKNVFQRSFERKNVIYVVQDEEDKLSRMIRVIKNLKGTGIVYMRNRKKTREIAEYLQRQKISAGFYHAGLDQRTRASRQEAWMKGDTQVIVATNAFGMGIDKPNVRFVIHMDIPDSIESYFQEAGRAGRDGKLSYAVMLFDPSDIIAARENLTMQFPPIETIRRTYHALGNYCRLAIGSGRDQSFDFELTSFCNQYDLNPLITLSSLKLLEKEGYIVLQEVVDNDAKVHFTARKEDLYKFQVENVKYDKFIKTLLRSYAGLFTEFSRISEKELADRVGLDEKKVEEMLNALQKYEIIEYQPRKTQPQITFLAPRLDGKDVTLSDVNYRNRKADTDKRLEAVISYLGNATKCRSRQLLAYFGEKDSNRCGKCDVCVERNRIELSEYEFDRVLNQIKPLLKTTPCDIKTLAETLSGTNHDKIIKVIQWLLDNDKVVYQGQLLRWNE
ncbi:MAG: RecQ family ATP-dependent DNA helicase [Bacteroidales bacterium]|nr:RecQ family ATP-dependent DNA helicase [Bacteroidales bacterium]